MPVILHTDYQKYTQPLFYALAALPKSGHKLKRCKSKMIFPSEIRG
jgi:hypothetical protein